MSHKDDFTNELVRSEVLSTTMELLDPEPIDTTWLDEDHRWFILGLLYWLSKLPGD